MYYYKKKYATGNIKYIICIAQFLSEDFMQFTLINYPCCASRLLSDLLTWRRNLFTLQI